MRSRANHTKKKNVNKMMARSYAKLVAVVFLLCCSLGLANASGEDQHTHATKNLLISSIVKSIGGVAVEIYNPTCTDLHRQGTTTLMVTTTTTTIMGHCRISIYCFAVITIMANSKFILGG